MTSNIGRTRASFSTEMPLTRSSTLVAISSGSSSPSIASRIIAFPIAISLRSFACRATIAAYFSTRARSGMPSTSEARYAAPPAAASCLRFSSSSFSVTRSTTCC